MTRVLNNDVTNGLWEGGCLKLLPKIADNSVNFILTDPPYTTRYRSPDGRSVPNDNNDAWLKPAFAEMYRVLKPDSSQSVSMAGRKPTASSSPSVVLASASWVISPSQTLYLKNRVPALLA